MRVRTAIVPVFATVLLSTCSSLGGGSTPEAPAEWPAFTPPPVRTEVVTDDYHGTEIADPYRWLEDQDGAETADFVARQNAASRAFLDAIPEREAIHTRLAELWNFPRRGAPSRHGDRWFHSRNDGLQNQDVWYVGSSPDDDGEVLLDPNTFSADGTVALAGLAPSRDGAMLAYATSTGGSDWQEWYVLDIDTGERLDDHLRWAKFTRAAWTADGKGFFYQRYPAPEAGRVYESSNENAQLCYHVVGTDQSEDIVVYERPDQPQWHFGPEVTESGDYLIITLRAGTDRRNRIAYVELAQDGWPVQPLLMAGDAHYDFLGHDGDRFWFRTDLDAPKGRVLEIDRHNPAESRTLVAELDDALRAARLRPGGEWPPWTGGT